MSSKASSSKELADCAGLLDRTELTACRIIGADRDRTSNFPVSLHILPNTSLRRLCGSSCCAHQLLRAGSFCRALLANGFPRNGYPRPVRAPDSRVRYEESAMATRSCSISQVSLANIIFLPSDSSPTRNLPLLVAQPLLPLLLNPPFLPSPPPRPPTKVPPASSS